jgi:hypothetical protein
MNALRSHRGTGDGMSASGNDMEHGKPGRCRYVTGNEDSARSRLGRAGWRRGP